MGTFAIGSAQIRLHQHYTSSSIRVTDDLAKTQILPWYRRTLAAKRDDGLTHACVEWSAPRQLFLFYFRTEFPLGEAALLKVLDTLAGNRRDLTIQLGGERLSYNITYDDSARYIAHHTDDPNDFPTRDWWNVRTGQAGYEGSIQTCVTLTCVSLLTGARTASTDKLIAAAAEWYQQRWPVYRVLSAGFERVEFKCAAAGLMVTVKYVLGTDPLDTGDVLLRLLENNGGQPFRWRGLYDEAATDHILYFRVNS